MSYISRQALLEKLKYMGDFNIGIDYVTAEDIMSISSADVRENIHGEWSRHTRVESVYSIDGVKTWGDKCQCNKCTFTTIAVEGFGYYNFCPNCGADMRGKKDDKS